MNHAKAKKALDAYTNVSKDGNHVVFQRQWFSSVIAILQRIEDGNEPTLGRQINYLMKIRDSLNLISQNINPKLPSEERVLLKNIMSTSIQVLNSAIKTRSMDKIPLVKSVFQTLINEW